jgi:hypothetical protein
MKTTTVPAQITTVEDKIAGNLTLQQMVLLGGPIFIDFAIYVALPHTLKLNAYKLILMGIITASANILAIRVKSKILLIWTLTIFRYNVRPRYYVFSKSSSYLRNEAPPAIDESEPLTTSSSKQTIPQDSTQLSEEDIIKLDRILANPLADLSFTTTRKGGLYVSISEVE